jgi:hypothetical protein
MDQKITRIDIEQISDDYLNLDCWYKGWREGQWQKPDECRIIEGRRLLELLNELSHNGYALTKLNDSKHWRALKGEIVRLDFIDTIEGWKVRKYPLGWTAKTQPLSEENKGKDFDIAAALDWLRKNHWTVMQWNGGARAWRYKIHPVRNAEEIRELRRRVNADKTINSQADLAYVY